jgi:hypothetical protein
MQGTLGDDRNPVRRGRPLCSNTEDKDHAQAAANSFAADDGTMWPKAAAKITDDLAQRGR